MAFAKNSLSIKSLKNKFVDAKNQTLDTAGALKDSARNLGASILVVSKDLSDKAIEATTEVSMRTQEAAKKIADNTADALRDFDYKTTKKMTGDLIVTGIANSTEYFKRTFEVDKSTMDLVQDLRSRLPTPVSTVDQIFDQCREEATRRAIAVFMLAPVLNNTDERSVQKYDKLSDSWQQFRTADDSDKTIGAKHKNYKSMKDDISVEGMVVENGYNRDDPLIKQKGNIDVEHVTSRKELFNDFLLSIGLTKEELGDVMNNKNNLVYADKKTNSQKSDLDLKEWVNKYKDEYQPDDDKIVITLKKSGEKRVLDKRDLEKAYKNSKESVNKARLAAATEVTYTVAKTGAAMATQQIVGLIIVETLDIFMDEIKSFKLMTKEGLASDLKEKSERIRSRLNQRFEERQIWNQARELGVEAGVAGALSVLPQILISLFLKMPAFVYALIRESTLSIVRSVRVLCSNDEDKLDSLKVIIFGAASAIAAVYVQRVISTAISGVPLLNKFNPQIASVMSGMIVMAIPLVAIYTFEQNKQSLMFRLKGKDASSDTNGPVEQAV